MKNRQERQQNQNQNQEVNRDRSMNDQGMEQGDMNRSDAGRDTDTTESDIGVA